MFELQPKLRGELLELRPLAPADFESLYQVASDPLIWDQHPDPSRSEKVGFRNFFDLALQSRGALLAIECATQAVIGCSRFHSFRERESDVTIGYTFLGRAYWGGRYNGEMKQLMLRHAFAYVRYVRFRIAEGNMRSRRAVEKLGAHLLGPEDHQDLGQIHVVYRIDRDR
jgi:RimJ/RimL family protein N-acetyltransferase